MAAPTTPSLVAHRGASAYAPEHTLASYRLALAQGADFVEQDLALTRDDVLVCLHDVSLERTTNVEEVFPNRFTEVEVRGARRRTWLAADFTLEEIKRLDAGAWFDERFAGESIPTWQEAIDVVRGHAGLYPELKSPALYRNRGVDQVALVVDSLRRNGLDRPDTDPSTPVILQSFDADALRALAAALPALPRVFLLGTPDAARWTTTAGLGDVARFATGIGPDKRLLLPPSDLVARAHGAGLSVTPYTFRATDTGAFASVRDEMRYYLFTLGVDALFTDHPDEFPRRP
jgi:glycerophosphoryl diester phosphodiesterase